MYIQFVHISACINISMCPYTNTYILYMYIYIYECLWSVSDVFICFLTFPDHTMGCPSEELPSASVAVTTECHPSPHALLQESPSFQRKPESACWQEEWSRSSDCESSRCLCRCFPSGPPRAWCVIWESAMTDSSNKGLFPWFQRNKHNL